MFNLIVTPVDGSRFAEAALPMAAWLAARARGRLELVMVHQPVAAMVGMGELAFPPEGLEDDLRVKERSYLEEMSAALGQVGDGPVRFIDEDGPAGEVVCEAVSRLGADLVVMATHGRGAIGRLWLGSVADYVVRHLEIPILLVHPDRDRSRPRYQAMRGILVALDLSTRSEAILDPVVALAQVTQAHITLIHTVEPFYSVVEPGLLYPVAADVALAELRTAEAQRSLDVTADRLRTRGVGVSTRVVPGANAASGILDALAEARYDLVALTTHGAGGARRLLLGSVADKVIRGAAKPVLVLRPGSPD